jgi:hypothetical protein
MSAEDRIELQTTLGQGEVHATLNCQGVSTLRETGVSGVWWVGHNDERGELVAELIEVCAIPKILEASNEEMAAGADALRSQLSRGPGAAQAGAAQGSVDATLS